MNHQSARTLQETLTTLAPAEVLAEAKRFFGRRSGIYAAFVEKEGPTYTTFRGQGGEELAIGVAPAEGGTRVTGSTYLFDQQIARFFSSLPMPVEISAPSELPASGDASAEGRTLAGAPTAAPAAPAPAASGAAS